MHGRGRSVALTRGYSPSTWGTRSIQRIDRPWAAAAAVGGGGGGRDTLAEAGGRDVEKLPQALDEARAAIEASLRPTD